MDRLQLRGLSNALCLSCAVVGVFVLCALQRGLPPRQSAPSQRLTRSLSVASSLPSALPFKPTTDAATLKTVLDCGDLCQYGKKPNWAPNAFQCGTAWLRLLSSCPAMEWPPPLTPPASLLDAYTMGGTILKMEKYKSHRYSGQESHTPVWDPSALDAAVHAPDAVSMEALAQTTYGVEISTYVEHALSMHRHAVSGKAGIVWGSERPWVEAHLARAGAAHVTTVEYGRIVSDHPRFTTTTPSLLAALMILSPRTWDFAFTYSSLEHSGLGRYGDALNPWGDMEAAIQTWCLLKPGGHFFLGLPCKDETCSEDVLVWNAHRYYGPRRLGEIFTGYEFVGTVNTPSLQIARASVIHVLRKPLDQ